MSDDKVKDFEFEKNKRDGKISPKDLLKYVEDELDNVENLVITGKFKDGGVACISSTMEFPEFSHLVLTGLYQWIREMDAASHDIEM